MSRVKNALAISVLSLSAALAGCATTPETDTEYADAIEEAMRPASAEAREMANRSDPLSRANFWSQEYAKQPGDVATTLEFANALRSIRSHDRAIEVLTQSLVLNEHNPDLLMSLGRSYRAKNNLIGAARSFEQAAHADPNMAGAWSALGTALDKLGRHDDAQEVYAKALMIEPDRTATLTNFGLSLALQGDLAGAEEKLRAAASQPDASAAVSENLALILGLQGKYDEMVEVSSKYAPQDVAQNNADKLRNMTKPVRSWDSLVVGEEQADNPASEDLGLRLRRSDG